MQTLRRNDRCSCGSGKKYKHCCLNKEGTQSVSDWSEVVPRAIKWLMAEHPHAVGEALDNRFFSSLDENEGKILHAHKSWETTLINTLDWLLAEGTITVEGSERRVSELYLKVAPIFCSRATISRAIGSYALETLRSGRSDTGQVHVSKRRTAS